MKQITLVSVAMLFSFTLSAQSLTFSAGTDFPYQFYAGASLKINRIEISYRPGILIPPYSDMILAGVEDLGAKKIYVNMLESAYRFGWMNSLGAYYHFGKQKQWYAGPEYRLDDLTAADTPFNLIEAVVGANIFDYIPFLQDNQTAELGLITHALGFRTGRSFVIGNNNHHRVNFELSAYKHIATQSNLKINGKPSESLNNVIDKKLWDNVFKPYGFIGGIGISYQYNF